MNLARADRLTLTDIVHQLYKLIKRTEIEKDKPMTALIAVVVMHNLNNEFVVLAFQGLANSVPDLHVVTYIRWVAICYHLIQILQ